MPMKSQSQRRFMWATDPVMARRWEDHTPKGKKLPERVKRAVLSLPDAFLKAKQYRDGLKIMP